MNLSTNTTSLVLEDRNMLNAKATADGFAVYLSINKLGTLEKINKTGGNAKIIIKNLSLAPQFNKSGSLAVALVNTSGKIPEDADFVAGTLVLIDVKNGKLAKTLAKKQTILGAWSDLDATYYFKSSQNKQITRMSTEDTTVKSTNIRTVSKNSPQISTFIGQGTNLYALGSANRLYSAGTNLENNVTTSKNDMVNGSKGIHEDGYSIYYYSSSNTYAISLESVLTDNSKQRALGKLQNLGINTSLQDIVYDNEYAALKGDAN